MKRIEDQSGLQWAAQVLREGSRNEKENFSLAEAPATGRKRKPFSLAEAPATGRNPFPLRSVRPFDYWQNPPFRWRCSRIRTNMAAMAASRSLCLCPHTPIPMPMSPYPSLHARSLNLPPKPDAHIPVPIRPDTHAR